MDASLLTLTQYRVSYYCHSIKSTSIHQPIWPPLADLWHPVGCPWQHSADVLNVWIAWRTVPSRRFGKEFLMTGTSRPVHHVAGKPQDKETIVNRHCLVVESIFQYKLFQVDTQTFMMPLHQCRLHKKDTAAWKTHHNNMYRLASYTSTEPKFLCLFCWHGLAVKLICGSHSCNLQMDSWMHNIATPL